MNEKLNAIALKAAKDLIDLICEGEEKIHEAWSQCVADAQDHETKPKFKLGYTITLNLDDDKMETALSFGIKYKLSVDSAIPDPNQPELLEKN